jgi:HEAT repeat protein
VEKRTADLLELGMQDDPASLDIILSELTNRDPEIRKAALEATIQFRSRDAIPQLMDAATQTDDLHEKAAIAEAIDFLKLPSISEAMEQSASAPANGATAGPNH